MQNNDIKISQHRVQTQVQPPPQTNRRGRVFKLTSQEIKDVQAAIKLKETADNLFKSDIMNGLNRMAHGFQPKKTKTKAESGGDPVVVVRNNKTDATIKELQAKLKK